MEKNKKPAVAGIQISTASIYHQKEKWVLRWQTKDGQHWIEHREWFNSEEDANEAVKTRELKLKVAAAE